MIRKYFEDLAGVLAQQYKSGMLNSAQEISAEARSVLMTPEMMGKVDARIPGWKAMSECADGQTLIHIVCAFIAFLPFQLIGSANLLAHNDHRKSATMAAVSPFLALCGE